MSRDRNAVQRGRREAYVRHRQDELLLRAASFLQNTAKALQELPKVTGEFSAELVPHIQDLQQQLSVAFNAVLRQHGYIK